MASPIRQLVRALALAGACALSAPDQAFAQSPAGSFAPGQQKPMFDLEETVTRTLVPGLRSHAFLQTMRMGFDIHDADRDGLITGADRDMNRRRFETMQRAQTIGLLLQADLNSDGVITREELTIFARYSFRIMQGDGPEGDARRAEQMQRMIDSRMRADTNGDGKIDWQELFASANRNMAASPVDYDASYRALFGFDTDGDGKTTLKEYNEAMERRFAAFDTDDDGIISRAEFDAYWQRVGLPAPKVTEIEPSFLEKLAIECAVPKPAKNAKFVLFNGYRPLGISSVALGSQRQKTMTTKVVIEPGPEPLYLVMIAWERTIWQFEGALDRLTHVVLAGHRDPDGTAVGATGLGKDRITIANGDRCGHFWVNMTKRDPKETAERTRLLFGREPDVTVSLENLWNLQLPSGQMSKPSDADRAGTFPEAKSDPGLNALRSDFLQYFPAGVVIIDPAKVIAALPVTKYEVLPKTFGLSPPLATPQ